MKLVLYTDKTIPQALAALNERMQVKGTSSRPAIDGWVEKNGSFCLTTTCKVLDRFERTTSLRGKLEKMPGYTLVTLNVQAGASRENKIVIFAAVALIALALIASGNVILGIITIPAGLYFYIPLTGDDQNSDYLISELQKTLKAKDTPPKLVPASASRAAVAPARTTGTAKAVAAKPATGTSKTGGSKR